MNQALNHISISINSELYLKDPHTSTLGISMLGGAIVLIDKLGFELFTFKKLANEINTTEASIYRYFENKHKLLVYLTAWYWAWLEFQISFHTNNMNEPVEKLKRVIKLLATTVEDDEKTISGY